jgi:hypothetical protein
MVGHLVGMSLSDRLFLLSRSRFFVALCPSCSFKAFNRVYHPDPTNLFEKRLDEKLYCRSPLGISRNRLVSGG